MGCYFVLWQCSGTYSTICTASSVTIQNVARMRMYTQNVACMHTYTQNVACMRTYTQNVARTCTYTHNSDFAYGISSTFSKLTLELKNSHPEGNIQSKGL